MAYVFIDGALMGGKFPSHHANAVRDWLLVALPDLDMRARGVAYRITSRRGEPLERRVGAIVYGITDDDLLHRFWDTMQRDLWLDKGAPGGRQASPRSAITPERWRAFRGFVDHTRWAWTADIEANMLLAGKGHSPIAFRNADNTKTDTIIHQIVHTFGAPISVCAEWMGISFYTLYDAMRPDGFVPDRYHKAFIKAIINLDLAEEKEEAQNAIDRFNERHQIEADRKSQAVLKGA